MSKLRIGLYVLAGTFAVLLTALAVLISIDLGMFKERLELGVTDLLGREFRIDGELHAYVGSSVEVFAEDVFLANPEWANDAAFVTARKIDVAVNAWSLVNGPIDIERLEIDGVRVNVEKNTEGDASWIFAGLAKDSDSDVEEGEPIGRLPIILDYAAINDVQVSYNSPEIAKPLRFVSESLVSTIEDDILQVELTGSLNGTPLHFIKKTSPIENLLAFSDVTVEVTGNVGEITINGSAWIDDLLAPSRPRLQLDIDGPNASYLTDILSLQPITTGALEFSVSIRESGEQMVASIDGTFGEFDLNVDGHFQDIQELHNIHLDISADGPDIGTLIRLAGREYAESDSFEVRGRISRAGSEVTIDNVLVAIGANNFTVDGFFGEFPTPKGGHLTLQASGPDYGRFNRLFGMPGRLGGAFTTSLNLLPNGDGRTRIEFEANAPDMRVKLNSLFSAADNFNGTTVQLEISGPDIGTVATAAGFEGLPVENFRITAAVEKDPDGFLVKSLEAVVDDDVFKVNGHIGNQPLAGETNLEIDFHGSNLGASVIALGGSADRLPKGAYYLQGRVQRQDEKLRLQDIRAAIGDDEEYQFQLSGFLTPRQQFVGSQLKIHAQGASLAALAELAGQQGIPDFPFNVSADVNRGASSTYFENGTFESGIVVVEFTGHVGDTPLEDDMALSFNASVPRMKDVIAEFGVEVGLIPEGDLVASGSVQQKNGKMTVENLEASFNGAKMQANGDIGQRPSLAGTRLTFEVDGDDLSRLLPPGLSAESLAHAFATSGRISLSENELKVDRFSANIGHTSFGGDVVISLAPFFGSGSFSLKADSPDVFQLLPSLQDVSVPKVAKMKYRGSGSWAENFWSFDDSKLELGDGYIEISGSLDGPPSFERTDLDVEWFSSSVRHLSVIAGRELPDQPLRLNARLVGSRDVMTMENFELTFGESDLSGQFTMRAGDIPTVEIDVTSRMFDVSEYQPEPKDETQADSPAADQKVIPDTPLPLELLKTFEADVEIDAAEIRMRSLTMRELELDASVLAGALKIQKMTYASLRGGFLTLSADLVPNESGSADFELSAEGENLVMGIRAKTEEDLQDLPPFGLRAELAASGGTPRELAGSMDGYVRVVGGAGRVPSGSLSFLTQDFVTELVSTINPFTKSDPYTNVDCAVILFHFDDGVVEGQPAIVQQTDKLRIFANVNVDLKTEKLDADFKMTPRKGLGISLSGLVNPYIKLTGTLASPSLVLNPESVFIEGGVAVATGGLSILAKSFKDRFLSDKDPCGKALAESDEKYKARQSGD